MPHISRNPLGPQAEKQLIKTLEIVLTRLSREEDMDQFLLALLSPTEQLMLAKRLAMIILLKEGLPESSIAEILHVTRGTVSKMQLFMEARGQGYEIGLRVLKNEKVRQEIKELLLNLTRYSVKAAGGRLWNSPIQLYDTSIYQYIDISSILSSLQLKLNHDIILKKLTI